MLGVHGGDLESSVCLQGARASQKIQRHVRYQLWAKIQPEGKLRLARQSLGVLQVQALPCTDASCRTEAMAAGSEARPAAATACPSFPVPSSPRLAPAKGGGAAGAAPQTSGADT